MAIAAQPAQAGSPAHNPAQQEVLDVLGAALHDRPTFDAALRHDLRARLEEGLAPILERLPESDDVHLSKHTLSTVHGCEVKFVHDDAEGFPGWTVPTARGTVAHKAIELSIHWRGQPTPFDLVDEALARLTETDHFLAEWLQGITEVERAELRAEAGERVHQFLECWPPLQSRWRPTTESRLRADLADGRVVLRGKVDLTLGIASGTTAGKVLVDLKTGGFSPAHLDDLRFYALVETIRLGVPPRRVATYYLDSGRFVPDDITEAALASVCERIVAGVDRLVELRTADRAPVAKPGPPCRWCPLLRECEPGRSYVAADDAW